MVDFTRTTHWTMALFALLSPIMTWTIEQVPNACHNIEAPNVHARMINMNEYHSLGVQRKRIILPNKELSLPEKLKSTTLADKLGYDPASTKNLNQYHSFKDCKALNAEGFPLITTIPIKIGKDLKNAKQITIKQL